MRMTRKGMVPKLKRRDGLMLVIGCLIALAGVGIFKLVKDHRSAIPYQAAGVNSPWIPSTVKRWQSPIDEMSKKYACRQTGITCFTATRAS